MNESRKKTVIGTAIALALLAGLFAATLDANDPQGDTKQYKGIVGGIQSSRRTVVSGGDPSRSLKSVQDHYTELVSEENFENGSPLQILDNQIVSGISVLGTMGENVHEENILEMRDRVTNMADRLGLGLPIGLEYAVIVVLGFGFALAFLANVLCEKLTDWSSFREAEEFLEEWRERLLGEEKNRGKKRRKSELEEGEVSKARKKVWMINAKQAFFYLALFFPFLAWLGYIYGGWTVSWLPFEWFASGALRDIGISLEFFGWFALIYFGFVYIWRQVLISEQS